MLVGARTRMHASIVGVLAVTALVVAACGSGSGAAGEGSSDAPEVTSEAEEALFESSVVHDIEVTFDERDYDAMVDAYAETGEKEWIEATVTIDGATYEQVGLRLKGNSSLFGLGGRPGGGGGADGGGPAGGDAPGGGAESSAADPESLPWLIRLDEFVDREEHQGYEDIVIRSNGSATSLNEAVALDLLADAGLTSQQAAATRFSANGGEPVLRLAIEHPDDDAWQDENFEADGALYKAESGGDWSYRGDDPAAYEEVFDQEGGSDVTDLSPLIEFLQFINESDDATFASELPERLDVESFAAYLAMMDLLGNFDDIDGPGNNAYLWYDVETDEFTIVPWDMNLALNGGAPGGAPGGFEPPAGGELPGGFEPPAGEELPEDFDPGELPGGGEFGRSNRLVERFHANAEFEALYQDKLTELRTQLYESGAADEVLASWVEVLTDQATDLVDEATITEEAESIAGRFTAE